MLDARGAEPEPLVEAYRSKGRTTPEHLRRTLSAILWRHRSGGTWRTNPEDRGTLVTSRKALERLWARLKAWRAIAARYEKTAGSFIGVLPLAAAVAWLRR